MQIYAELRAHEVASSSYGYELWVHDLTMRKMGKWGSEELFETKEEAVKSGEEVARSFLENRLDLPTEVYTLEIRN